MLLVVMQRKVCCSQIFRRMLALCECYRFETLKPLGNRTNYTATAAQEKPPITTLLLSTKYQKPLKTSEFDQSIYNRTVKFSTMEITKS